MKTVVVVAWHNPEQVEKFQDAWSARILANRFHFQQDVNKEGCAATKNKGIQNAVKHLGADVVIVLDDDCFPTDECRDISSLINGHLEALEPLDWAPQFAVVTSPQSRGTPYNLPKRTPVAASVGWWSHIGDYDAASQLVLGATEPMTFKAVPLFGQYFPMSGMNIAFRPKDWLPWCQFIDVPRFDDIWMGWLWQREAYRRGYCFNLRGPTVKHSRQSNVWQNLRDEAKYLEQNETLWQKIASHDKCDYESLRKLLPV